MSTDIETISASDVERTNELVAHFQRLEGQVALLDANDLPAAWQSTIEAHTLLSLRRAVDEAVIAAKRLEAHLLRRFAQAEYQGDLSRHEWSAARYLAELTDSEWEAFLAELHSAGKTASDAHRHRREREEHLWRQRRTWRAQDGEAADNESRMTIKDAAITLVQDLVAGGMGRTTAQLIEELADEIGVNPFDAVARRGVQNLLTQAVGVVDEEAPEVFMHRDGKSLHGKVPAVVVFNDSDGFVRMPWRGASMRQLYQMLCRIEDQAAERREAAESLRAVYTMLTTVVDEYGCRDVDSCSDLLMLGRVKGLISGDPEEPSVVPLSERFPKAFEFAESGLGFHHMERFVEVVAETGIYDEQSLDEATAEDVAKLAYTGANRVTAERFAYAYCPRLLNTFAHSWEMPLGWGLPEEEAEKLRREADARIAERMNALFAPPSDIATVGE